MTFRDYTHGERNEDANIRLGRTAYVPNLHFCRHRIQI